MLTGPAPSYFTQFFEEQIRQNEESGGVRTLYIDRDPVTFRDVARHLQGTFRCNQWRPTALTTSKATTSNPETEATLSVPFLRILSVVTNKIQVKLFADAQFYSCLQLHRLCSVLLLTMHSAPSNRSTI
jgi:hypothetical protein